MHVAMSTAVDICQYHLPMSSESLSFGSWLRDQVGRRGWQPADFARAAETSTANVTRWMSGVIPGPKSCRKIAQALGLEDELVLYKAGHIAELPTPPRHYELRRQVEEAKRLLAEQVRFLEERVEGAEGIPVRLVGRVPADSIRWTATDFEEQYVRVLEDDLTGARNPFALEVTGDCLKSLGILDGDIVICDRDPDRKPRDGETVVVRFHDEVTLKVWFAVGDDIELRDGDGNVIHRLSLFDDYVIEGYYITVRRPPAGRPRMLH